MKSKRGVLICAAIGVCIVVLAASGVSAAFCYQFHHRGIDQMISTDTLSEVFFNGGNTTTQTVACQLVENKGMIISRVCRNEMADLQTQLRFRVTAANPFKHGGLFQDAAFTLTDANGRDLTQEVIVYPESMMGLSCLQIVIPIDNAALMELADSLILELRLTDSGDTAYAECTLTIPI